MLQIALVSHEHDDYVGVGVIAQFLQPPCNVDVGCVFGDVVDQEGTNCTSVVARRERAWVSLSCGEKLWCGAGRLVTRRTRM